MVPVTGAIASYADDLVGRLHTATLCRALAVVPYAKRRAGAGAEAAPRHASFVHR